MPLKPGGRRHVVAGYGQLGTPVTHVAMVGPFPFVHTLVGGV
jgi:hypothetical protein